MSRRVTARCVKNEAFSQLPPDIAQHITTLCGSTASVRVNPGDRTAVRLEDTWGTVDAILTLFAIARTCKWLRASITDEAWDAAAAASLPFYATVKVSNSQLLVTKRRMLRALAMRPGAPAIEDTGGVRGVWALLDSSDICRAQWMAPKHAIAAFHAALVVDLPEAHVMQMFALTAGDLTNLVPRLRLSRYNMQLFMRCFDWTEVLRVARRKHVDGAVKLTKAHLRTACDAVGVDSNGPASALKLRLHEAVDPYGSPWTDTERDADRLGGQQAFSDWTSTLLKTETLLPPIDLTFLPPQDKLNPRFKYADRLLLYTRWAVEHIRVRKSTSGARMLGKRATRKLCAALGLPQAPTTAKMLYAARLAIDPNGRITRRRQATLPFLARGRCGCT
jgi:hypothetical protein